tara:strand:- start:326 stop:763 length:438 start_codon:yes stop_codon:yes gene_type:complete
MDKQRVVNLVIDYYVRQKNAFGYSQKYDKCTYRDPDNGRMCAIGFLAQRCNKLNLLCKEQPNSDAVAFMGMKVFKYVHMDRSRENLSFLADIQSAHDNWVALFKNAPDYQYGDVIVYDSSVTNEDNKNFVEVLQDIVTKERNVRR